MTERWGGGDEEQAHGSARPRRGLCAHAPRDSIRSDKGDVLLSHASRGPCLHLGMQPANRAKDQFPILIV